MASVQRSVLVPLLFTFSGGPGIVLVLVPHWITRFHTPTGEPLWQMLLAGMVIILAFIPLAESIRRFTVVGSGALMPGVPPEHLVISGPYRYTRNAMYAGVVAAILGETLLFRRSGMLVSQLSLVSGKQKTIPRG